MKELIEKKKEKRKKKKRMKEWDINQEKDRKRDTRRRQD